MKIYIYIGGKDKRDWALDGINHFKKLLKSYAEIIIETINPETVKTSKPELLFNRVPNGIPIIVCDEKGCDYDSSLFTGLINEAQTKAGKLVFFIGAHEGFSDEVRKSADHVVSLSKLTFGHRLTLIILLEQLFRTFDLMSTGKYHR